MRLRLAENFGLYIVVTHKHRFPFIISSVVPNDTSIRMISIVCQSLVFFFGFISYFKPLTEIEQKQEQIVAEVATK